MFLGVTAPILLIAALFVVLTVSSGGDGGGITPQPPRSDVAGVCVNNSTLAVAGDCATAPAGTNLGVTTRTPVPPTPTPAPRTYTVKAGDTLYSICAAEAPDMSFDSCAGAIVDLSDLDGPDQIAEGQSLRLPAGSGSTSGSASTTPSTRSTPVATPVSEPEPEVEEPDPTPSASLVALGPVEPVEEADEEEATPDVEESNAEEGPTEEELDAVEGTEYTVEDGDSVLGICVDQVPDMPEDECIEFVVLLNDLGGPDEVQAGQVLLLP